MQELKKEVRKDYLISLKNFQGWILINYVEETIAKYGLIEEQVACYLQRCIMSSN